MSQKQPSEEPAKDITQEETIARYLAENPDFFVRHIETLAALRIPHYETGRAISLIERQVEVLRHKHRDLHLQFRDLVTIARQNDMLSDRLHRFAIAMISSASFDDVISTAHDILRQEFKLDAAAILLTGAPASLSGHPGIVADGRKLDELIKRHPPDKPAIGAVLDADSLAYLFRDHAGAVRSCALAALGSNTAGSPHGGERGLRGLIALGSNDPSRFHPDMASHYLTKLSGLLMTSLERYT